MIVECNQCHAKFRLDDSKISDRGVKVRCSKCKNIFTVKSGGVTVPEPDKTMISLDPTPPPQPPPQAPKPQAPPPPPHPPAKPPKPSPTPPAAPKQPEHDSFESFDFKEDSEPQKESTSFDDGLGDLSFADESPPSAPPSPAPPSDSDLGDFSKTDEKSLSDSGTEQDDFGDFDFDDDISSDSETSPPSAPAAKPASSDALGDFPDFSASEPEPPPPSAPSGAGDSGGAGDLSADDFGASDFDLGDTAPPPPSKPGAPAPPAGGEGIDEFGDISFDDSGMQESKPPAPPPKSPAPTPTPSGSDELEIDRGVGGRTMDEFKQVSGGAEDSYAFDAGSTELPDVDVPARPAPKPEARERIAPPTPAPRTGAARKEAAVPQRRGGKKFTVVIIILVIVGGGFFLLNKSGKLDEIRKTPLKELNFNKIKELIGLKKKEAPRDKWEFSADAQRFYSVTRDNGFKIWVLRGNITNRFTKGMRAILLEGQIKDGDAPKTAQNMAGPQLSDEKLRTLSMDKIHEILMSTLDETLEPRVLLTDANTDFVIVFEGVTSARPTLMEPSVTVIKSEPLKPESP